MFPRKISKTYPSPDWQYGDGRYYAKGWFSPRAFQVVLALWRVAVPSATKKRTTPLCSSLLASISNAGRTHTLHYTHLQSNKETTVKTCTFSLRMSPTLQMAVSICDISVANFCEECVLWRVFGFHETAPYV